MQEPARAAALKSDRVKAESLRLRAGAAEALNRQPLALTSEAVRDLMWRAVGLFRDREGLERAVTALDAAGPASAPSTPDDWRQWNLLTVARLIARAALRREESRGGHFRADFPARDDLHWQVHLVDQYHG
jgi:succinate dehydrogenase/fumarate reductase flavoprotein subunit